MKAGLDGELLGGVGRELGDELVVQVQLQVCDFSEREVVGVRVERLAALLHDLRPVPLADRGVAQVHNKRHGLLEPVDGVLERSPRPPLDAAFVGTLNLLAQLHHVLVDSLRGGLHLLHAQIAKLPERPDVVLREPVLDEVPERAEHFHLRLHAPDRLQTRRWRSEDAQALTHFSLARAEGRRGGVERRERFRRRVERGV
mmetsp:Transcript_8381/g.35026  ORF Transcript_8381/g.35026 Transcript_8381/m.35026 type:complete len:200 (+) Transcript_8381:8869-9468(+)